MTSVVDWEDFMEVTGAKWNHKNDHDTQDPPLPDPSGAELRQRWAFRKIIQDESLLHRRIHTHAQNGPNILLTLHQREIRGCRYTVFSNGGTSPKRKRTEEQLNEDCGTSRTRSNYPTSLISEIQSFAEYASVTAFQTAFFKHLGGEDTPDEHGQRPSSSKAVSTISVAFSPDAKTMASTHGDHSVKITCCSSGILLKSLDGHPRTPWTVKYNPISPEILASGCLGFQVRVWNWVQGQCLQMIRLDYAIISLSFHPSGRVLAIASGSRLHFWDYDNSGGRLNELGRKSTRGVLTEVEQRHMLRCVHFPPNGTSVIVGGMNPNENREGRIPGDPISFYLRLWEFDLDVALHPENGVDQATAVRRKLMGNPRTVIPRAMLYNDGGFDVSPDGKVLCACAEYWLPDGVNSAMELLEKEQDLFAKRNEDADPEYSIEEDTFSSPTASKIILKHGLVKSKSESHVSSPPLSRTPSLLSQQTTPTSASFRSPPRERASTAPNSTAPPRSRVGMPLPLTPPNPSRSQMPLSPPSPPGRRFPGGLGSNCNLRNGPVHPVVAPPPRGMHSRVLTSEPFRRPHPLSVIMGVSMVEVSQYVQMQSGQYVPHVVTVSLDTSPLSATSTVPPELRGSITSVARGYRPRLGQLLEACPLDKTKASAVTCVKFSPSAEFCLLGYGVREPLSDSGEDSRLHPVTALYRVRGGMTHVSTMLSGDDDVNIARFHPDSGYGFVYGTKQGRVRVLSPRPWNYYNC